ncbi:MULTISPECIES: YSIRK-type signal peptide-containing protein [unclassified Streptococcus]|uniref:YSIRK-type signal peptide-containing protein n=1 Tax=Streptococcus sp. X16XC17 TaxID=2316646 RepID=UPI00069D44AB|nr:MULTISPECIES: YSIRK-type signal peptide-containing protein [unclassified Streptococcus]
MEKKQRFSLRKYKTGIASVLLGSVFLVGAPTIAAQENAEVTTDPVEVVELTKLMPNGYYLEGFVRFENANQSDKDQVHIPFVGFRGEFENLAVIEEDIYRLKEKQQKGFYFEESDVKDEIYIGKHFTGLVMIGSDVNVSAGNSFDNGLHTLGTFRNKDGKFILEKDASGKVVLAISPNGDNNQDFVAFKAVFLRKYRGLKSSVYAADDKTLSLPLWESADAQNGDKNFNSDVRFPKSTTLLELEFNGKDTSGADLPDGRYQYVLSYYSDVVGGKQQKMIFDIVVDREKPILTSASYDPKTKKFKAAEVRDKGQAGILRDSVFYLTKKDGKNYTVSINDAYKYVTVGDNKQFVEREKGGSYLLPLDKASLEDFYYMVEDFAGNIAIAKISQHMPTSRGQETVTFELTDGGYQHKVTLVDHLEMTYQDTGLVTN